jgi:hypothetical protein
LPDAWGATHPQRFIVVISRSHRLLPSPATAGLRSGARCRARCRACFQSQSGGASKAAMGGAPNRRNRVQHPLSRRNTCPRLRDWQERSWDSWRVQACGDLKAGPAQVASSLRRARPSAPLRPRLGERWDKAGPRIEPANAKHPDVRGVFRRASSRSQSTSPFAEEPDLDDVAFELAAVDRVVRPVLVKSGRRKSRFPPSGAKSSSSYS